jgi:hypothetical protein
MLVADSVFREEGTRKVHIAGTFNYISAAKFPARHDSLSLFLAVTELRAGEHKARIEFSYRDEDEQKVLEAEGPINAKSPLQVSELNFRFRGIVFPKPGTIEIAFYLDDEPIQIRKFKVLKKSVEAGENDG